MGSIRSRLSDAIAAPLRMSYNSSVLAGKPWKIPLSLWELFPSRMQSWLGYKVYAPGAEYAESVLRTHDRLKVLALSEPNPWVISGEAILFIHELLWSRRPQRIIEMGSGRSTLLFAMYAEAMKAKNSSCVEVVSLEHDASWLEKTRQLLSFHGVLGHVRLVHAPICETHIVGRSVQSYDLSECQFSATQRAEGFDLCLIDGPPATIGRFGTLPIITEYLADNAIVLLDDSFRAPEQEAWKVWHAVFHRTLGRPAIVMAGDHGLGVAVWNARSRLTKVLN